MNSLIMFVREHAFHACLKHTALYILMHPKSEKMAH